MELEPTYVSRKEANPIMDQREKAMTEEMVREAGSG